MQNLHDENRLHYSSNGIPRIKKYVNELKGIPVKDVWSDINQIQSSEKLDYATQKPVKLIQRIVRMFSNPEDLVCDPFAGSGTTGRACKIEGREGILIDINPNGKSLYESTLMRILSI